MSSWLRCRKPQAPQQTPKDLGKQYVTLPHRFAIARPHFAAAWHSIAVAFHVLPYNLIAFLKLMPTTLVLRLKLNHSRIQDRRWLVRKPCTSVSLALNLFAKATSTLENTTLRITRRADTMSPRRIRDLDWENAADIDHETDPTYLHEKE